MSGETVFDNIFELEICGDCKIRADGVLQIQDGIAMQIGNKLKIEDAHGSGKGGSITINNGSMSFGNVISSSGGSSLSINGVQIRSSGRSISLTGPSDYKLIVNGVETSFAAVASRDGGNVKVAPKPKKIYRLGSNCKIDQVHMQGGGTCEIDSLFFNDQLSVNISGSGDFIIPDKQFRALNATITGSGEIYGRDETQTSRLQATVTGSGSIKDIFVLDGGSATVTGSGDISVSAVHPERVSRSQLGTGRVRVARAAIEPEAKRVKQTLNYF